MKALLSSVPTEVTATSTRRSGMRNACVTGSGPSVAQRRFQLCSRALLVLLTVAIVFIAASAAHAQDPSVVGQWSPLANWPFINTHAMVLPNGKVLWWPSWANGDNPMIYDPVANTNTALPQAGYNIFCAGLALMPNGQVLITGGDASTEVGPQNAVIFDPNSSTWTPTPDMNEGRWYPTNTPLPNGNILVTSGEISPTLGDDPLPQIWQPSTGSWLNLSGALLSIVTYPEMYNAPNGTVYFAGSSQITRFLDTTGVGSWTTGPSSNYGLRDYGPSVTFQPGQIIIIGGGMPPTATAEVINLNDPVPTWTYTSPMNFPRRQDNANLLPDGTVLVTGDSSGPTFDDSTHPVFPAELWNPATGTWTVLASLSVYRGYHSIAILLPDGRVLSAGGSVATSEIFSPPYLFKGARPTITSAPATANVGQTIFVSTPDAASINMVSLIRPGATTHTFNENQAVAFPSFTQASGGLNVTLPSNGNLLPPGYYMLFLVNSNGIPSVASFINISNPNPSAPPNLSLSRTYLPFSTPQAPGTTSGALAIVATNLGTSTITFSGTSVNGPDFGVSSSNCASLAAGATCKINIVFHPTKPGSFSEVLTINDSDSSSPQLVQLKGTSGGLAFSTTSLNLGTVTVGTTGSTMGTVTLTNMTSSTISFTSFNFSDSEYSLDSSSTCGSSLTASANCVLNVDFTPTKTGTHAATLVVTDSDSSSPTTISLTGVGQAAGNHLALSATSFNLGTVTVGTTGSAKAPLTLTNNGTTAITFTSLVYSDPEYSEDASSTCTSSLAGSSSCIIYTDFKPTTTGTRPATLVITDSDASSPSTITLTGVGKAAPSLTLSTTSFNLGTVTVGTTGSAKATLTLTNNGTTAITFTSLVYSDPEYSEDASSTCTSSLAGSSSCIIYTDFKPTTTGTRPATLVITDSDASSPSTITLTGVGQAAGNHLALSATSLNLGTVTVGTTGSAKATLTLTNNGTTAITFTSLVYSDPEYSEDASSTCTSSLAGSSSCIIYTDFKPTTTGTRPATLVITDSDASSPSTITLTGVGQAAGNHLALSATSFNLGTVTVGTTGSAKATLTLTNNGTTAITFTSLVYSDPEYSEDASSTCTSSLAGSSSCIIYTDFKPTTTGTRPATLVITDSDASSPSTVTLTGVGKAPAELTLSAKSFNLGKVTVGATGSAKATLTLTNNGSAAISFTSLAYSDSEFFEDASSTCGSSLAGTSSCIIYTDFKPNASGTRTGTLVITDSDSSSPSTITFTGVGKGLNLSATSFNLGTVTVGTTGTLKGNLTLTNVGTTTITFTSLVYSDSEFAEDPASTCGSSLAASSSCIIYTDFTPNATGARSGILVITDSDASSPSTITYTGTGK